MVYRNNDDSWSSSLGGNNVSVLNGERVLVEEFPRVQVGRTEIVRLKEEEEEEVRSLTNVECFSDRGEEVHQHQQQNQHRKSARFSLFNWFKKGNEDFGEGKERREPEGTDKSLKNKNRHQAELDSLIYSSSGSVDTTCSTATVHSFTFRSGSDIKTEARPRQRRRGKLQYFRKHLSADDFAETANSSCVNQFDSEPSINNVRGSFCAYNNNNKHDAKKLGCRNSVNIADFKEENRRKELQSATAGSVKNINNKEDKINKSQSSYDFYRSLPTAGRTADLTNNNSKKRYAHVKGKRPAPKPPVVEKEKINNTSTTTRRKRQAPKPPEDKERIKKCTAGVTVGQDSSSRASKKNENDTKFDKNLPIITNDTLKLEGGILLPRNKTLGQRNLVDMNEIGRNNKQESSENAVKKTSLSSNTNAVVVPRPWYKRSNTTLSERDICGSFRREVLKIPTLSKSSRGGGGGDKGSARFSLHSENAPENSQIRNNHHRHHHRDLASNSLEINTFDKSFSRLNHLFGRSDNNNSCKTKKDEKRKSNLTILTNISELDREAAAIVQEEQARNQALSKSNISSKDLNDLEKTPSGDIISEMVSASIEPQRRGTRALISKFNAISSNITKVTVNATFFTRSQTSAKIDVVRTGESRNNKNIVTKRLLCDGREKVNETSADAADISSINFFRRLEAEASKVPENSPINPAAAAGWEEKIKRYFPERVPTRPKNDREELRSINPAVSDNDKNYFLKERELRNLDRDFPLHDHNRSVDKIEHLSRADLKEMLIEMKHSLPKRPKAKSAAAINNNNDKVSSNITRRSSPQSELSNDSSKISSSTKASAISVNRISKLETPRSRINAATAASSSEIKREDEKQNVPVSIVNNNTNKTKVSSAAQTSANLRKVELSKAPRERQRVVENNSRYDKTGAKILEDTIYTTKERKSSNGAPPLARNTFQLIRPRDFACIEALKTDKGGPGGNRESQNTYMNVIEDSIYANTVINTPRINGDDKCAKKIEIGGNKVVDDEGRDAITALNDRGESSKQNNKPTCSELEPRKTEMRILGAEGILGKEKGKEEEKLGPEPNMNTMAINRLLRKLEGAIASGQHQQAAGLAKELAQLKIHCSVVRQRSGNNKESDFINVDMYIEDKLAHQGPIPLQISLNMTVAELKKKIFDEFEIPVNVQRWIIGKNLADNDDFTINQLKAVDKSSIFLYLVAPDLQNDECTRVDKPAVKVEAAEIPVPIEPEEPREIVPILEEEPEVLPPEEPTVEQLKLERYEHLMSLENSDVIPNSVPIECPICFAPYGPCEGVILRDCLHMFCRTCIANTIMYCEEAEVKCPFRDSEYTCESTLQEREIKALVTPEIYEQHLAKSVSQAENSAGNNAFHCKTPDCPGWCIYDDNVNVFLCPVCGVNNCLTCQAIHTDKNCREYQDEIRLVKETDQETKRTAAVLEEMVESGEALACPTCAVVLMKKWGCDWLRCSMCKTEICWVTRGPRWGPAGKGDTSGGCKCGENGVKCHPRCNYCH